MQPFAFLFPGFEKCRCKRRVRCVESVEELLPIELEKESCKNYMEKPCKKRRYNGVEDTNTMPLNRLALYRGIIKYRMLCPKKNMDCLEEEM